MKISIKKTTLKDSLFFYNLRNQKKNRKQSLNSSKISIKDHLNWFSSSYKNNYYYTCYVNKKKSGYIRGESKKDLILISIAFLKEFQKKNIVTKSFRLFEQKLPNGLILIAKIKEGNINSKKFFIKNNFIMLNKQNSIFTYYKIHFQNKNNYIQTIDKIENIRKGNNVNWMNILRIAFKYSPLETSTIFKNIFVDDNKINKLSKKLF